MRSAFHIRMKKRAAHSGIIIQMKAIPHPIQYQGSKRNLAPLILRYAPKDVRRIIEPFAGSASISIAAAARHIAESYIINDLNKPLAELLRMIVERPLEIASSYEQVWNDQSADSLQHYYRIREDFNRTQDPRLFLYLLARCVKGSVRYNSEGQFNQSPDKRRNGTMPVTMRDNIIRVSALLKGKSAFSSLDYREALDKAEQSDLVYMDPPYQGVCGEHDTRYLAGISSGEFISTLQCLNSRGISYIVSYDGRREEKTFGQLLPDDLNLIRVELKAGRSTQSTLLGRDEMTYESLYLSQGLTEKIDRKLLETCKHPVEQYALFEPRGNYA